jgi:SAM-dependent methyltransferase
MKEYYQENHRKYYDQTFSIDPTSFLLPLARCLHPGSTIMDVGCGSGRDMRWLKDQGFQPEGFERSQGLAGLARAHSGCPVLEGDFEVHDFSGMKMDAILLVGALVHVPHDRFSGVFSNILRALRPGGHLLLTLKEGRTQNEHDGNRIFYLWRDEDLRDIFDDLGLVVKDFLRQISKIRETDVWLGYVLQRTA